MNTTEHGVKFEVVGATQRYLDAYIVAKTIIAFGKIIKVVGFFVGGCIGLLSLSAFSEQGGGVLGAVGLGIAIVFGLVICLLGILMSALGQILMATLDTAVNSSIFLSAEEKAEAMSLQICQGRDSEPQPLGIKPPVADAPRLFLGAWRDEEGLTTFRTDGTEKSEFNNGSTESGKWSIDGHVLTVVITERDSKPIDPISIQFVIMEISNSSFYLKQLGNADNEWRASRV